MTYHARTVNRKPAHRLRSRLMLVTAGLGLMAPMIGPAVVQALNAVSSTPALPSVIINEVKSGGTTTNPAVPSQYVTVYNSGNEIIDLAGLTVEYAKQAFPATNCTTTSWAGSLAAGSTSVTKASLSGTLAGHSVSQPFTLAINDNDPGSVHLIRGTSDILDTVGWGTSTAQAACYETAQAGQLTATKSLQRYTGCVTGQPIDTNDNSSDFFVSATPRPGQLSDMVAPQCALSPPPSPEVIPVTTPTPTSTPSCEGIAVSEILPNPAGTDTGHEFVELHNPTSEVISLEGCKLQSTASTAKSYSFDQVSLQPGEYRTFSDTVTGLTLPNSAGGTVWLLNAANVEIQSITYPADMDDDTVWTLADGTWSVSFTPTPGNPNIATPLKPCADGEVRNPDSNRCVSLTSSAVAASSATSSSSSTPATAPADCKPGQERNPATNRCRATASASSTGAATATACKAGQERNPDTNRCRNIVIAATTKACPAGQERNADTNRCRKITAAGSANGSNLDAVKDVSTAAATSKNKPYWLIAAAALAAVVAYGVYEWRQEIAGFFDKRFGGSTVGTQPAVEYR